MILRTCLAALTAALTLSACATIYDDMRVARQHYAAAAYEDALTWLDALAPDIASQERGTRARWYYLRGMTAFRMGDLDDARHYLAIAHVIAGDRGVGLPPDWIRTLDLTLGELRLRAPVADGI